MFPDWIQFPLEEVLSICILPQSFSCWMSCCLSWRISRSFCRSFLSMIDFRMLTISSFYFILSFSSSFWLINTPYFMFIMLSHCWNYSICFFYSIDSVLKYSSSFLHYSSFWVTSANFSFTIVRYCWMFLFSSCSLLLNYC